MDKPRARQAQRPTSVEETSFPNYIFRMDSADKPGNHSSLTRRSALQKG